MKILLSSRWLFAICFIILVATNILVLSGVASNRSGEPESKVTLTERELQLPYQVREENSGLALRLTWRALGKEDEDNIYSGWRTPIWLSAEKLEELGFNIKNYQNSAGNTTFYKQPVPKEVLIVFENDGEPYREVVRRAAAALERAESVFKLKPDDKTIRDTFERAKERLNRERLEQTRLFAIDAGLDLNKLRDTYGDQSRFIIAKGLIEPRYDHDQNKQKVFGYISELSVASIHVPLQHRGVFDSILAQKKTTRSDFEAPRFEVELAYGSRLEPWIVSVKATR